ncbi:MAG: hypothetical protein J1F02_07740 [Lachnospiraceae bacterium]|nr:hypothetical protein [Lachnospiraceae bacterium]
MFAKISKKVVAVALVAAMAVTTATVSADTASAAKKVKLNKKSVSISQSKTVKLKASAKAKWSTSNKAVATVSTSSGKSCTVRGIAAGTATITATAGGKKATCKVTVKAAGKGTVVYNLANETGSDPTTGESWGPPVVCKYEEFKYNSFRIWLCRATLYDPANGGVDYRGRKLSVSITVQNSGKRDLPELGVCFNYTKGGTDGAYPFALHVSEKALAAKVKKDKQHRHTTYKVQKIKKGKTYTWNFTFTIPKDAMNGDKDQETGLNYPIMMYIPNMKDTSPYKPGDAVTVKKCVIKLA